MYDAAGEDVVMLECENGVLFEVKRRGDEVPRSDSFVGDLRSGLNDLGKVTRLRKREQVSETSS